MQPTHLVSVAALVTNDRDEILLVKSPWRGWEYPGGLIEPGESFEEALCREVMEETGVEIEITGFIGICKNVERNIVNIDFTAKYVCGELKTSEESTEVIWASAEKARELITFPLTQKRLETMLSGREGATLFCFKRETVFEITEETIIPVGKGNGES